MSLDANDTSGDSWGAWMQSIGSKLVEGYVDYKVTWPGQIQQQQINRLGDLGYYAEGQPGYRSVAGMPAAVAGFPTGMLMLGGAALLLVFLLKD